MLSQPQKDLIEVLKDPEIKDIVIHWSRRGGKTHHAINEIIKPALYYIKDAHISYVTTTLKHAKDIVWEDMAKELDPITKNKKRGEGNIVTFNRFQGSVSEANLLGWTTIDAIRGTHNDIVIYDETQLLGDFFSYHNTAVSPTMATTKGKRFYLFTGLGFNHAYTLAEIAKTTPGWHYSRATWEEFPHIDREFITQERGRMSEAEFSQEYECAFVKPDGLILDQFNNDIHIFTEAQYGTAKKRIVGVDFGYGKGNTAILFITLDENNRFWVEREEYRPGKELKTYQIAEIVAKWKPDIVYADSADPSRVDDLQRTGLPVVPVKKFNNYKKGLIARVNQVIGQDRLIINKACTNLVSEINMWFWSESIGKDIVRPDNTTKHDAIDALLYAIGMHEENLPQNKVVEERKKNLSRYNPISI